MLVAPLVALSALGLALWLLWPRESAITEENIARIQPGMTRAEVEAVLGGPARDETGGRRMAFYIDGDGWFEPNPDEWIGDEWVVTVNFDHGRVSGKREGQSCPVEENLLSRFRRWLRF
jgi:outer membrane protein assembly factor BamE (lipoprotein component of BamABCDE complex)